MAKQKKPAPSGKKGGNGAGTTTFIAERLQQQADATTRRKAEQKRREHGALMRGAEKPAEEVIFSVTDMVAGKATTGCLFEAGGSIFELGTNDGKQVYTLKQGAGELAKWTTRGEGVFVCIHHLLMQEFEPRVQESLRDKQGLMWFTVASTMDDSLIDALANRLKQDQLESERAAAAAAEAERFVGPADAAVWLTAIGDPAKFDGAFKELQEGGNVNLRLGKTSQDGAVVAVSYRGDFMQIQPIHIGQNCPMSGVVLKNTYLRCNAGRLDETLPEIFGDRGEGVAAIWAFIMNTEYVDRIKVRDVFMGGMYHAYRRLHNQPPKLATVGGQAVTPVSSAIVSTPAPAPVQLATSAPAKPTGKVNRADAIKYVLTVMPIEVASGLIGSGASIKVLMDTAEAFAAQKQQVTSKSA
jgi:hypothetical protein